jgi:hypothetical protein
MSCNTRNCKLCLGLCVLLMAEKKYGVFQYELTSHPSITKV